MEMNETDLKTFALGFTDKGCEANGRAVFKMFPTFSDDLQRLLCRLLGRVTFTVERLGAMPDHTVLAGSEGVIVVYHWATMEKQAEVVAALSKLMVGLPADSDEALHPIHGSEVTTANGDPMPFTFDEFGTVLLHRISEGEQ